MMKFRTHTRKREAIGKADLSLLANVFCPTGPGGGVDPSCSPGGGGGVRIVDKLPDDRALKERGVKSKKMDPATVKQTHKAYKQLTEAIKPEFAALMDGVKVGAADADEAGMHVALRDAKGDHVVVVNPDMFHLAKGGGFVDSSPAGVIRHELGHALEAVLDHRQLMESGIYTMEYRPSRYAEANTREKVAEFFTQITKPGFKLEKLPKEAQKVARYFLKDKTTANAFCPTGEGGGRDNSCSSRGGGGRSFEPASAVMSEIERAASNYLEDGRKRLDLEQLEEVSAIYSRLQSAVSEDDEDGVRKYAGELVEFSNWTSGTQAMEKSVDKLMHGLDALDTLKELSQEVDWRPQEMLPEDFYANSRLTVNPFKSEAQRRWMYANDPEMAKRWEAHTPRGKKLPRRKRKKRVSQNLRILNAAKIRRKPRRMDRVDPTRTVTLRRAFSTELARRFSRLKLDIVNLIVKEDAFGLTRAQEVSLLGNAFCPTGPGGGIDPSCSPGGAKSSGEVDLYDESTGEVYWTGPRDEAEKMVREQSEVEPGHTVRIREATRSSAQREAERQQEVAKSDQERAERIAEQRRQEGLSTPSGLLPGHRDYREPPERLYHATFAGKEIRTVGFKSSDELGTQVLGGTSSNLVSFTDKAGAERYRDSLNHAREAAQGRMTEDQFIDVASGFGVSRSEAKQIASESKAKGRDDWFDAFQAVSLRGRQFPLFMGTGWSEAVRTAAPAALVSISSKDVKDIRYNPGENEWRVGDYKGVAVNAGRWYGVPDPKKIEAFKQWLRSQIDARLKGKPIRDILQRYVEAGLRKGAGRAFDDTTRAEGALSRARGGRDLDFYRGSRESFLRSSFNQPETVEKVELLVGRSFSDLEGITDAMDAGITRALADGLVQGKNPREIARDISKNVDGIGRTRAMTMARTEIIRAHAEGQLTALEKLGVEEVGVAVEWSTAGDERVCDLCAPLQGVVLKLAEARGMLPRHPNCRCAWIPANVGEDHEDQKTTRKRVQEAIDESGEGDDEWDVGVEISTDRPESILDNFSALLFNVFCPTGRGGGVDPTCSLGGDRITGGAKVETDELKRKGATDQEAEDYNRLTRKRDALKVKIRRGKGEPGDEEELKRVVDEAKRIKAEVTKRGGKGGEVEKEKEVEKEQEQEKKADDWLERHRERQEKERQEQEKQIQEEDKTRKEQEEKDKVAKEKERIDKVVAEATTRFEDSMDRNPRITTQNKVLYKESFESVMSAMGDRARDEVATRLKEIVVLEDTAAVTAEWNSRVPPARQVGPGTSKPNSIINGLYNHRKMEAVLDGITSKGDPMSGASKDIREANTLRNVKGTYAHELGHALDNDFRYSKDPEWRVAWRQEIRGYGKERKARARLSEYARNQDAYAGLAEAEGFAEFSRLMYGSHVEREEIKALFPKCYDFFLKRNFIAE